MEIYYYNTNVADYSVPFDWDKNNDHIDYIDEIVETYFDTKERVGKHWQPTFFGVIDTREKIADLGSLVSDGVLVFSQKAVDILRPLLGKSVELLPYKTEVGPYYLVNVLDEGEYLDRERTESDEILSDGRCVGINKFAFHADRLRGKHIFRISDDPVTRFISGEFVAACREHGLSGIYLNDQAKVWDSATA
ncbi:imm11 family protein [Hymenobacter fodinae]|uniref:Immunity MXAN-0049 protein domain-containing protein n=1 Tax=Hymenobacter fodinae TaxID=2510796 RepID=A0A4Z0P755_9BACT|nr:DUF1629 domain-containing protein [Hymenobacter fodinae]TGE07765.1 hypothetical protein EU556_08400 [Hymenobacter fodinae]